jgi:glycosyltransferase involved in cell wall biosynthesis
MPVYNAERYVVEAIESILAQTFRDFEFLIIDDGSTDRSLQILRKYERQDARIRLISRRNTGIVIALNEMVGLARGVFIARMDADDIAYAVRFERQVEHLRRNPECVVVGAKVLLVDSKGAPICEWCHEQTHQEVDDAHLGRGWPMVHPAVMMRREAVLKLGGYRPRYYTIEDRDLFLRLAEIGTVANLPDTLLKYRKHVQSICHRFSRTQQELERLLTVETRARRRLPPESAARPKSPTSPTSDNHAVWAWWALGAHNVKTARRHAVRSLVQRPLSFDSWKLLACSVRGH